jgi:hypothetical protein
VVTTPPPSFAADPGARFITTSFLGVMLDICVMQPGRVLVVAVVMVILRAYKSHSH